MLLHYFLARGCISSRTRWFVFKFRLCTISLTVGIVPNLTVPFGIIVSKDGSNACFMELWGNMNFVVTEHLQEHLTQRVMCCEFHCLQLTCIQPCHLSARALRRVSRHAGVTAGSSRWHSVCPHRSSQCHIPHLPRVTCIHTRHREGLTMP